MTLDDTVSDVPRAVDEPERGITIWPAYRRFWQRALVYTGRAGIAETWWPALVNVLVGFAGTVVIAVLGVLTAALRNAGSPAAAVTGGLAVVLALVLTVYTLAAAVAGVAIAIRRLHDADLSGWLVLTVLVPSVGTIILAVLCLLPASPRGRRYDRAWLADPVPLTPPAPLPAPRDAAAVPAFDSWPTAEPSDSGLRDALASVGPVTEIVAPDGRRLVLVDRGDVAPALATDGLREAVGAELALSATGLRHDPADRWETVLLAAAARRVQASGKHLPDELDRWGTLSMTLAGTTAPDPWRAPDGTVGVLIGLPVQGLPGRLTTPQGEVALIGVAPLLPSELQQILDGGGDARTRVAGTLAAMPEATREARADRE